MRDDGGFYTGALAMAFPLAVAFFLSTSKWTAYYGRHRPPRRLLLLPPRLAWIFMEIPGVLFAPLFFSRGRNRNETAPIVFLLLFVAHYINRALVYPLRTSPRARMPLEIALMAFCFNLYNAYLQGRSLSEYSEYPLGWLHDARFLIGSGVFLVGFATNVWADGVLLSLRAQTRQAGGGGQVGRDKGGRQGYVVPRGGLFEYVSCPNYLGETVEWLGWAIMTWSLAGLAFFLLTVANLGPRAVAHHAWYLRNFTDYPKSRKAILPFLL